MVSALVSANFQVYFTQNFQVLYYTALYYTGERTSIHKAARGHRRHTSQPSAPDKPRLRAGMILFIICVFACFFICTPQHSAADTLQTPYRHPTDTLQTHSVADELRL